MSIVDPSKFILVEKDGGYVALDPQTKTASQGDTREEALINLCKAVELYLEVMNESDINNE